MAFHDGAVQQLDLIPADFIRPGFEFGDSCSKGLGILDLAENELELRGVVGVGGNGWRDLPQLDHPPVLEHLLAGAVHHEDAIRR